MTKIKIAGKNHYYKQLNKPIELNIQNKLCSSLLTTHG